MAWRTTPDKVEAIIRDVDEDIDLRPFITVANTLVDKVAAADTDGEHGSSDLAEIERWLAAHFYESKDNELQEEKTEEASGKRVGEYGMGLERTSYGQNALMLDTTGFLRKINKGVRRLKPQWLGKVPSNQTDYVDRD
jgi:hypothetical protein